MSKMNAGAKSMTAGCKAMAERAVRAEAEFIDTLCTIGGVGRAAAERAFAYYRKHKIATVDAVVGRVEVAHGAFLEPEVIQKAAAM